MVLVSLSLNFLGGGGVGGSGGVGGGALVADLGHEPVDVVGGVLGGLDPAVGEGNHVAADDDTVGILGLGLLEVCLAVVIVDSVLVGEGLGGQLLLHVGGGGAIGGGAGGKGCGHKGGGNGNLEHVVLE